MITALVFSLLAAFSAHAEDFTTPTKLLAGKDYPMFTDDEQLSGLDVAIQLQIDHYKTKDLSGTITMGGTKYPLTKMRDSLQAFLTLISEFKICRKKSPADKCFQILNADIAAKFNVFAPDLKPGDPHYGTSENAFFTSYATQPLTGKGTPDTKYSHAIYAYPHSPQDQTATRDQIDFHGALNGKGLELLYAENLFDLYLLHVEGGGYVTQIDATGAKKNYYLTYDGENGKSWDFISKYMMKKGYITNGSLGAQRKYLDAHPEKQEEIYSQCPSYVFFKVTTTPPEGAEQLVITPGRSIATDSKLFAFKGLLAFIQSQRPVDEGVYDLDQEDTSKIPFLPFSRFFIDQDTGGAITGKGRADLYMGVDGYAQYMATYEAQDGNIFFLLLK